MEKTIRETQRASEVTRLSRLLHACDGGLSICSISGPGGVGKTYLVEQVLSSERPLELGYIYLSANASNPQTRGDFFGLVEGQLATPSLPPPARPNRDYFPQTRKVAAAHRELVEKAAAELGAREGAPEEVKRAAVLLLRAGHRLNELMPKTREHLNVAGLGLDEHNAPDVLDEAWDMAGALKTLSGSISLPRPIGDILGQNLRDRVRRDLFNGTAEALLSDLTSLIDVGNNRRRRGRPKEKKPARLLVWLDDYETLAPLLGDFLVGSLIPRLASAPFPTLLVVGSRDDLEATHPGWGQHAKRWLREQIRLAPFDKELAFGLLAKAGIAEERWSPIYEATRGFPFLLTLAIEEATAPDAESALFAKKFFDRTTRWMTPKEREWFAAVCYLDVINEDTLRVLFPEGEVPLIQEWFEREASIRDPTSRSFQMRPLVREKALRYLETRSPSRHREMLRKAKGADAGLGGPAAGLASHPPRPGGAVQ
jgi:hypothetical protein